MTANATQLISSYSSQLSSRFYSNSMALQVLICLLLILVLAVEVVKFAKKSYQWQTEYEINLEMKYADQSRSIMKERPPEAADNQNDRKREIAVAEGGNPAGRDRMKKEVYLPPIIRVQQIIKNKVPQVAILAVNVVMMSSYEFMSISAYIAVVLVVISEILGVKQAEHINLKLALDILSKMLMLAWYINLLTVPKPAAQ